MTARVLFTVLMGLSFIGLSLMAMALLSGIMSSRVLEPELLVSVESITTSAALLSGIVRQDGHMDWCLRAPFL